MKTSKASFYYILKQLQKESFIEEIGSKQKANRPEQTIYKLTPNGRKEFLEQISYFLNQNQTIYYDIDAITPFLKIYGLLKGKQVILDSLKKQIQLRKEMCNHIEEGEKIVCSHFLFDLNPFSILPLKHFRFHNEAEIKWLETFFEMVESIDFDKNAKEIVNRKFNK